LNRVSPTEGRRIGQNECTRFKRRVKLKKNWTRWRLGMISSICGTAASSMGLAAYPDQDPQCVRRAVQAGINYFFFYGPGDKEFITALKPLASRHRDKVILASGSGARSISGLRTARRKILSALGDDLLDIFFAEYINPSDDSKAIFGPGGVLDELQQWKANGSIRYVGATSHDRKLAKRLAQDRRVDVLMHRFNMAHRKAAAEVFPSAVEAQTPIIAFTATRWGTLLKSHPNWPGQPPTAADCYRFCLAQAAVQVVLTSPKTVAELNENLPVLKLPSMTDEACEHWQQFGDIIYEHGRGENHDFESQWP
jgi:aryl-alcohol dehydrogenase-like predicted oxidoreductase